MKKQKRLKLKDTRISRIRLPIPLYIGMFFAVGIAMMVPVLAFGGSHLIVENPSYTKWYIIYCSILSLIICLLIGLFRDYAINRPVRRLSRAAKKVAEGDFSIYLPPRHTSDKMDYMDTLYMDFNQMVAELGSIETLKNDFASNVSHEFKTPLAGITNYLQLLDQTELTEEQRSYVNNARDSAARLSSLVYNILKMNKLESQNLQLQPERYDLCRQLAENAISLESVWEKKNIEFEAELEDEAYITADKELMGIVWNNLLSNALKFTEPGGRVLLKQYTEDEYITVEVADTGCGMSENTIKHMFDKFYQGDTSHAVEGNGLGLALTLRVLQMSGGTITAKSKEGEGSIFTVRLKKENINE